MRALSLWQPWASYVMTAHEDPALDKRIENREWKPSSPQTSQALGLLHTTIAIHAAKRYVRSDFDDTIASILRTAEIPVGSSSRSDFIRSISVFKVAMRGKHHGEGLWTPAAGLPFGAILGTARIADVVMVTEQGHRWDVDGIGCLHGCALTAPTCRRPNRWAIPGCIGLELDEVKPFAKPIPFAGLQGFFNVPDELLRAAS